MRKTQIDLTEPFLPHKVKFYFFFFSDVEMCSETDSTNECSDFKSELDDDLEDPTQRKTSGLQQPPPPVPPTRTKKDSRVVFV